MATRQKESKKKPAAKEGAPKAEAKKAPAKVAAKVAAKAPAKLEARTPARKPEAAKPPAKPAAARPEAPRGKLDPAGAKQRLSATGRNDPCPCGSGRKYKKCHLGDDETAAAPAPDKPDPQALMASGWRLFEQRRPGAAEKEFRAALAVQPDLADARVGIGMARLQAGDTVGARAELALAVEAGRATAAELSRKKVKDAFTRTEAQAYLRASHALGCLAYDEKRWDDTVADLERVFAIDEGNVGTEARLVAGKAHMKLEKPAKAADVIEPAVASELGAHRAQMGLGLALFAAGKKDDARRALGAALEKNPHFGKAIGGRVRRHVENMAGAQPGTMEEALVYAQTYGDVWTDDAKQFLDEVAAERAAKSAAG